MDSSSQNSPLIRAFDRGAATYRQEAVVQDIVARRLADRITPHLTAGATVLDLGAGVGTLTVRLLGWEPALHITALDASQHMLEQLPESSQVTGVRADFDRIPFPDHHFDAVVSSAALQWSPNTEATLQEWVRVLKPGGILSFATFTEGTLQEWANAWKKIDRYQHVNTLISAETLELILHRMTVQHVKIDRETETMFFPTWKSALKSVRAIGANRVQDRDNRRKGLSGRAAWEGFEEEYETMRTPEGLPLSYQVFYGGVRK